MKKKSEKLVWKTISINNLTRVQAASGNGLGSGSGAAQATSSTSYLPPSLTVTTSKGG